MTVSLYVNQTSWFHLTVIIVPHHLCFKCGKSVETATLIMAVVRAHNRPTLREEVARQPYKNLTLCSQFHIETRHKRSPGKLQEARTGAPPRDGRRDRDVITPPSAGQQVGFCVAEVRAHLLVSERGHLRRLVSEQRSAARPAPSPGPTFTISHRMLSPPQWRCWDHYGER